MKKEYLERWTKALRSGEYRQGQKALVRQDFAGNNLYCCLGVLCELVKFEVGGSWDGNEFVINSRSDFNDDRCYSYLPGIVADLVGLSKNAQQNIAAKNDLKNPDGTPTSDFATIADYLEQHHESPDFTGEEKETK